MHIVNMKNGMDMMIASGGMMLVLLAVIFYSMGPAQTTGYAVAAPASEERMEAFATCVYESGATLYLSDSCPECEEQKALFGENFDAIKTVLCEGNCDRSDVTKFPTWIINGGKYEGKVSLEELSELTGCKL